MLHLISEDLGCLSGMCGCDSDAWIGPVFDRGMSALEQHLRLRAEFERYLAEKGDVE